MGEEHYCENIFPKKIFPGTNYELLTFLSVILYFLMGICTIFFIFYGKYQATRYTQQIIPSAANPFNTVSPTTSDSLSKSIVSVTVKSIIFPIYEYYLYFQAIISIYTGIILSQIPIDPGSINSFNVAVLYASCWALQHGLIEGLSIVLLQPGCGWNALKKSLIFSVIWFILCFFLYLIFFLGRSMAPVSRGIQDFLILAYYGTLIFLPQRVFYRRPAVLRYSKFWFTFRIVGIILHLGFLINGIKSFCSCSYYFFRIVLFCLFQPVLSYDVMLLESEWWQGLSESSNNTKNINPYNENENNNIVEFSLTSAHTLAKVMDNLQSIENVLFLNSTTVTFQSNILLGNGSFSQVVKGVYDNHPVAIKTIFTNDLTIDIIHKIAAETRILSQLKNSSNVVSIYGIILSPPSICIVLELCEYGSLSNILRGYEIRPTTESYLADRTWSRLYSTTNLRPKFIPPFSLTIPDILHLALGAAKGVHAIHSFSPFLCHRDVKSFNFLVDSHLTVKIADLELGDDEGFMTSKTNYWKKIQDSVRSLFYPSRGSPSDQLELQVSPFNVSPPLEEGLLPFHVSRHSEQIHDPIDLEEFQPLIHPSVLQLQATWLAPEVMTSGIFTQAADIYSLALVFWEIRTKHYPYSHCNHFQTLIRKTVLSGYREPFPPISADDPYGQILKEYDDIISVCWRTSPEKRLKSHEIVNRLESLISRSGVESLRACVGNKQGRLESKIDMSHEDGENDRLPLNPTNLYQLLNIHGAEWMVVSPIPPFCLLYLSNSSKLSLFQSLPTSRRLQYEDLIRKNVPILELLSLLYTPLSSSNKAKNRPLDSHISAFVNSCVQQGYAHLILKWISSSSHSSSHLEDIVALHGYPITSDYLQSSEDAIKQSYTAIAILFSHVTHASDDHSDSVDHHPPSSPIFDPGNPYLTRVTEVSFPSVFTLK